MPALIAAALGWEGIWGSGSALHVPSFVVAGVAMLLLPNLSPAGASRAR